MLHTGSRGLGYQVCDDFLASMTKNIHKHGIPVPDRQLACAKIKSPPGEQYYRAMASAANFAWANRQVMLHLTREVFQKGIIIKVLHSFIYPIQFSFNIIAFIAWILHFIICRSSMINVYKGR